MWVVPDTQLFVPTSVIPICKTILSACQSQVIKNDESGFGWHYSQSIYQLCRPRLGLLNLLRINTRTTREYLLIQYYSSKIAVSLQRWLRQKICKVIRNNLNLCVFNMFMFNKKEYTHSKRKILQFGTSQLTKKHRHLDTKYW